MVRLGRERMENPRRGVGRIRVSYFYTHENALAIHVTWATVRVSERQEPKFSGNHSFPRRGGTLWHLQPLGFIDTPSPSNPPVPRSSVASEVVKLV
jgi:hypothetical protein